MRSLLLLHLVVLIFGFTGILGKLISLPAPQIVWIRMLIAFFSIAAFMFVTGRSFFLTRIQWIKLLATGSIIALHWVLFFQSIKVSTVSICLSCLSTATLFTALIEPFFYKRKIKRYELLLSLLVITGLVTIYSFETQYTLGIVLSIFAALLASLFTVLNGKLSETITPSKISCIEMLGGTITVLIWLLFLDPTLINVQQISLINWGYLFILGLVCTAFAFVASVLVMKNLTPFTVSLSINLEPVYGIILALLIFNEKEHMTPAFYLGTGLILSAVLLNAVYKRRERKQLSQSGFCTSA